AAAAAAYLGVEPERATTLLDGLHLEGPENPTLRTVCLSLLQISKLPDTPDELSAILASPCRKDDAVCGILHNLWRVAWKLSKISRFSTDVALDQATIRWLLGLDQPSVERLGWLSPDKLPTLDSDLKEVIVASGDST